MAVIISRRQEGKDAGLSLTTEWLCSLSPATDSTGQDWGDGDDQQPPGKAAGEDEGQQDGPASPAVGDGPSAWVLLQGPCPEILTLCILTQSSSSTVLSLVIKQSPLYFIIYENEAGLIVMNLDFVCSSLLVWELVCAVLLLIFNILESRFLTIFLQLTHCLGTWETVVWVRWMAVLSAETLAGDLKTKCLLHGVIQASETEWPRFLLFSQSIYISVRKYSGVGVCVSIKFMFGEKRSFFVRYLNLYKNVRKRYGECILNLIAWGRGSLDLHS